MIRLLEQIMAARSGAIFSDPKPEDSLYRYVLWRRWGDGQRFAHLNGLNPSKADAMKNDPTIRREIGFAQSWGMDGLIKTNAFAFRTPSPEAMKLDAMPIGQYNDDWIERGFEIAEINVACWGVHGTHMGRDKILKSRFTWKCFGLTKEGHPKHPLYLKNGTPLVDFNFEMRQSILADEQTLQEEEATGIEP